MMFRLGDSPNNNVRYGHFSCMRVTIEKAGINGEGIAYLDQKPVFIDGALPTEVVEIELTQSNPTYHRAKIVRRVSDHPQRIVPPCPVQAECGGCALMIADVSLQHALKLEHLKQSLRKYVGRLDFRVIQPLVVNPQPLGYRNQFKLPVQFEEGRLVAGLYAQGSNRLVKAKQCLVHDPGLEAIKPKILRLLERHGEKAFDFGTQRGIRTLVLRGFDGRYQLTLVIGKQRIDDELVEDLLNVPGIVSVYVSVNTVRQTHDVFGRYAVHRGGEKTLPVEMEGLRFELSPLAFFQLNRHQAKAIFTQVASLITPHDVVVDAYCGVGAMSLVMAKTQAKVIGLEINRDAVSSAKANAALNGLPNATFLCGDASELLAPIVAKENVSVLVVDPPRSGLSDAFMEVLGKAKIPTLIYVSCNPSTLAKNLGVLQSLYTIRSITPYDMFTQTPLLEAVVHLTLK
jgi:23S rRNA (uracil-5-)-methyltransferase RumA